MNTKRLPWFRMYTDFLNDPKMISLAFEDQRHFVGILALKSDGALESQVEDSLMDRIVAQRLWIDHGVIRDVKKRLVNAGLISVDWHPLAWDRRQMNSDKDETNAQRQQRYRDAHKSVNLERNALYNGSVTRIDKEEDTDKEVDKKNTSAVAAPDGVSPSLWTDFKKLRSVKKAALTNTALKGIANEAQKAGVSMSDALTMCCERGWTSFRADWHANAMATKPAAMTARNNTHKYAGAAAAIWGNDSDEGVINV